MLFNFGLKSTVLLIFFSQSLVFGSLLAMAAWRQGNRAHGWLAGLVGLFCLYLVPFMLGYAGWYAHDGYREFLFYMPLQQLLLLGPVAYFYLRSLLDPAFRLRGWQWLHLGPGLLYLLYSGLMAVTDLSLGYAYFYADGRDRDLDFWYQLLGWVSMVSYFGLSLWHYQRHQRRAFATRSDAEAVVYRWVQRYLVAVLILLVLRLGFFVLNPEWGEFGRKFWYYLCLGLLTYYLGLEGYLHVVRTEAGWDEAPANWAKPEPAVAPPVADSGLDLPAWRHRLAQLMTAQALYLNPGLTLDEVATALDTPARQVSQAINQALGCNFNDYVNRYRVAALIQELEAGAHHRLTLLALALACGFNSKSTFNRAFKKETGLTPQQYLRQLDAQKGGQNMI